MIPDDPHFNIDHFVLPNINLEVENLEQFLRTHESESQGTSLVFSQMSPLDRSVSSLSSGRNSLAFDFLQWEGGSQHLSLPAQGERDSSVPKQPASGGILPSDDDIFAPFDGGFGFEVDAEGNLIELGEPDLPPLRGPGSGVPDMPPQEDFQLQFEDSLHPSSGGAPMDTDAMVIGEPLLPDAEAFPSGDQRTGEQQSRQLRGPRAPKNSTIAGRRRRKAKVCFVAEAPTQISDYEYKSTGIGYLERSEAELSRTGDTGGRKAKENAFYLTFGIGIASIGQELGVVGVAHPLAQCFSGTILRNAVLGKPAAEDAGSPQSERGRGTRRSASEAFNHEAENTRRVRRKTADQEDHELNDEIMLPEGDDVQPEVGRRAHSITEARSSSGAPWSRQGSMVPGSSVKSAAGRRSRQVSASPLVSRGTAIADIERFNDPNFPAEDYAGGVRSSSLGAYPLMDDSDSRRVFERAAEDFLTFAIDQAKDSGALDFDDGRNDSEHGESARRWVAFDRLAEPGVHDRQVAAQAFHHTLVLATRGEIAVRQHGLPFTPFGKIEIGINVPAEAQHERDEDMEGGNAERI